MSTASNLSATFAGRPWRDLETALRPFVRSRVGSQADADDVMQDVLLRLSRREPQLAEDAHLSAWIHKVARRAVSDHYRAGYRQREREGQLAEDPTATEATADLAAGPRDEAGAARDVAQMLIGLIPLLPAPYRGALTVVEVEGISQAEAATRVGISLSGMRSRVQRGRKKLRELLERCCDVDVDRRGNVIDWVCKVNGAEALACCPPHLRPTNS